MRRDSPGSSTCSVKQKHSVLMKYDEASVGATLGTALPTIACGALFLASNQASVIAPGCTFTVTVSGAKFHASALLTVPTNCTVTQREVSTLMSATTSPPLGAFSILFLNTCVQMMRYIGTQAKPN